MTLTYPAAADEMRAHLWAKWQDGFENGYYLLDQTTGEEVLVAPPEFRVHNNPVGTVYVPELRFENIIQATKIDEGRHLGRFATRTASSLPVDHRNPASGNRIRLRNRGICITDIYYSISAYRDADALFISAMVKKIFERRQVSANQVKFRSSRIFEQPPSRFYFQTTIFCEFEFDEVVI